MENENITLYFYFFMEFYKNIDSLLVLGDYPLTSYIFVGS